MRTKEDAQDYRYFPDPDLLPLKIDKSWIETERQNLPELPAAKRARYQKDFALPLYDAGVLTNSLDIANYFENTVKIAGKKNAKPVANWVMGDLAARLNRDQLPNYADSPITPEHLASLISRIEDGTISNKIAKRIFEKIWESPALTVDAIIEKEGLKQITDFGAIDPIIDAVLSENPENVAEFKAGKEKAFNALVGKVMKQTKGKASPQMVNQRLKEKLQ